LDCQEAVSTVECQKCKDFLGDKIEREFAKRKKLAGVVFKYSNFPLVPLDLGKQKERRSLIVSVQSCGLFFVFNFFMIAESCKLSCRSAERR
jgi:hypothetical protein